MSRIRTESVPADLLESGNLKPKPESGPASMVPDDRTKENETDMRNPTVIFDKNYFIDDALISMLRDAENRGLSGVLTNNISSDRSGGNNAKSSIYFEKGRIIHAYHGKVMGKKALYRIFSEKGGQYQFQPLGFSVSHTISQPMNLLLEEGDREIGVLKRLDPGTFGKTIRTDERTNKKIGEIADKSGLIYILTLAQQHSNVGDIINASQMSDLQTYKHLLHMVRKDIFIVEGEKRAEAQIVTDSSADLPASLLNESNIISVPFSQDPEPLPPAEADFHSLFRKIVPDRDIVAIFLSKKMGRVFENAMAAGHRHYEEYVGIREQKDIGKLRLEIIDSRMGSMGTGLLVLEAAEKARNGWPSDRIRNYIEGLIPAVRVFFISNTRKTHARRSPSLSAPLLGRLLRRKPVLAIRDGDIGIIDHVRNDENARQVILELMEQSLTHPRTPVTAGIMHIRAEEQAARMRGLLKDHFNCQNIIMSHISPVLERYCGPGTVAIAWLPMGI